MHRPRVGKPLGGILRDMAAPANLSFETAGISPGLAASWVTLINAPVTLVADFDDGTYGPRALEDYSFGWPTTPFVTAITSGDRATFDGDWISPPKDIEQYDRWESLTFRLNLTGGIAAQFDGALTRESYEYGWQTGDFADDFSGGAPDLFEDYGTDWPGDPYVTTISGGTAALFTTPSGTATVESYEHTFADVPFVCDITNNRFVTGTAHGLTSNQKGQVVSTGKRPGGVPAGTHLYVIVVSPTTFQVSAAPGPGSPITLTDVGFGDQAFKADSAIYWTDVD